MLNDLADLFAATIEHAPATGFNGYGEPSFGTGKLYPARVVYRGRMVRAANGDQTISRGEVWIAGTPFVGLNDRITLPDGTAPLILSFEMLTDEAGPSHVHVYFG